jgi:hypothetical protein
MLVNRRNLISGINYWLKKKKHWPDDFHNLVYFNLRDWSRKGINREWWWRIVDLLQFWQANRPYSREEIFNCGLPHLRAIGDQCRAIENKYGVYPILAEIETRTIRPLFEFAEKIKKVKKKSPVFPSKLCHFLFPTIFFVADREAVGIVDMDYFNYWDECKNEWYRSSDNKTLIHILRDHIENSSQFNGLFENYPFEIKITELCRIGYLNKA